MNDLRAIPKPDVLAGGLRSELDYRPLTGAHIEYSSSERKESDSDEDTQVVKNANPRISKMHWDPLANLNPLSAALVRFSRYRIRTVVKHLRDNIHSIAMVSIVMSCALSFFF